MPGNSLKCTKHFLPISFFTQFVQIAENYFCAKQRNFLVFSQYFCAISPLTFSGLCKTEKNSDFFGKNLCNLTFVQNAGRTCYCIIGGSRVRPARMPFCLLTCVSSFGLLYIINEYLMIIEWLLNWCVLCCLINNNLLYYLLFGCF